MHTHLEKPNNSLPLNYYLVGGAVRDQLLQRQVKDKDYVVVGATVEQMLALGFTQVGKDFPVFLHPQSKDEYALARTEKKQGKGYTGFICSASADVTLAQDLLRRDLTVNAIAQDAQGNIIDPYHGVKDLKDRILRHVSPAFSEDPLRVLRVARFAARYHYLNFTICADTMRLMTEISQTGELQSLSTERVLQEVLRSIGDKSPWVFFDVLDQCHALPAILPEVGQVWQTQARTRLIAISGLSSKTTIRFAALVLGLQHKYTEQQVEQMLNRLKSSNEIKILSSKAYKHLALCHRAFALSAQQILSLFNDIDVWRKPQLLKDLLMVCQADHYSQIADNGTDKPYPQSKYLLTLADRLKAINAKEYVAQGLKGQAIKAAVNDARLNSMTKYIEQHSSIN